MEQFDIPIVLFIFKRSETISSIFDRISQVKPKKLYILADGPRNADEYDDVMKCRKRVEKSITWPCEVIRNYSETNRGVYANIGQGAVWVLKKEEYAIFLEDDNLPEVSFFYFCKELLGKYKYDTRILWICGTNYLEEYNSPHGHSYVFSRHMLPCGWASWQTKFPQYYDGELKALGNKSVIKQIKQNYENSTFYRYDKKRWTGEYNRLKKGKKPISWDYQMAFTLRLNGMFGIVPVKNQIKNIGVDENSIHGGSRYENIMVKRFCGMNSLPINFPLIHPDVIVLDQQFEHAIGKIILPPFRYRLKGIISSILKMLLRIDDNLSVTSEVKNKIKKIRQKLRIKKG